MAVLEFIMNKVYLYALGLLIGGSAFANTIDVEKCLTHAYPNIKSVKNNTITFKDGNSIPLGTVSGAPFTQRLKNASVADQLSQTYPLTFVIPKQYQDAGRLRDDRFFKALYGNNKTQVQNNLIAVTWKPSGKKIYFNQQNNAAAQLQKVGDEIAQNPALTKYVSQSLGAFNWRVIAGTQRLSSHSFGVAVDFQLPKAQHRYWRWSGCTSEDKPCPYPSELLADKQLLEVVKIFEKHGFIWGGKWASYDSPHFEYRPELLIAACRT